MSRKQKLIKKYITLMVDTFCDALKGKISDFDFYRLHRAYTNIVRRLHKL